MPNVIAQPRDKAQTEAAVEARKREERDALNDVFDKYSEIVAKVSEASTSLGQAIEKIVTLDRAIRHQDSSGDLMLARKLRVKVILGTVFPARQHMDRLVARMKAVASSREDVLADAERSKPAFE